MNGKMMKILASAAVALIGVVIAGMKASKNAQLTDHCDYEPETAEPQTEPETAEPEESDELDEEEDTDE